MRVDQHGQHAQGAVVFDEAHAAHVRRQVVDNRRIAGRHVAGLFLLQIHPQVLGLWRKLIPLVERLDVDDTDFVMALPQQVADEMATDETAAAAYHDQVVRIRFHDVHFTS